MEWVDINIPWHSTTKTPEWQAASEELTLAVNAADLKAKKILGKTHAESRATVSGISMEAMDWLTDQIPNLFRSDQNYSDQYVAEVTAKNPGNKEVAILARHRNFIQKWNAFIDSDSDVIEAQRRFDEANAKEKELSFLYHPLNRPGVEIVVRRAATGEEESLLIGHMDPGGGGGSEWSHVKDNDIVVRYRVVYVPGSLG